MYALTDLPWWTRSRTPLPPPVASKLPVGRRQGGRRTVVVRCPDRGPGDGLWRREAYRPCKGTGRGPIYITGGVWRSVRGLCHLTISSGVWQGLYVKEGHREGSAEPLPRGAVGAQNTHLRRGIRNKRALKQRGIRQWRKAWLGTASHGHVCTEHTVQCHIYRARTEC